MKKILTCMLAACAAMLSSCVADAVVDSAAGECELNLRIETDAATRVGFGDGKYFWEGGETLGVYVASATPTCNAVATVEVRDGEGWCKATVNRYAAGDMLFAYHPYSEDNAGDVARALTLAIEPAQTQTAAGVFGAANMPMVSMPQPLGDGSKQMAQTVVMRSLGGFLRVNVFASGAYAGESVLSVKYADEDTPMSGKFEIDATAADDEQALDAVLPDTHFVMTTLAEAYRVPAAKADAAAIYMVLAAGDYDGEFTVTTDKAIYTYNYKRTVARNTYYDVNVDLSKAASRRAVDGEWGGGDGSAENPYLIASVEDLQRMASLCNGEATHAEYAAKHYRQIRDIDMSDVAAFKPVGDSADTAFGGHYDGGDHAITGLVIANVGDNACGLFGYLNGATVVNLRLKDYKYTATGLHAGSVAGVAEKSTVSGCSCDGEIVSAVAVEFDGYKVSNVGGIVGYALDSEITNCTFGGHLKSAAQVGGIAGYAGGTKIEGCSIASSAAIDCDAAFAGGIVGRARYGSSIVNCRMDGKVSAYNGNYVGGIASHLTSGKVSGCEVSRLASISSKGDHAGGIVGALQPNETEGGNVTATVEDCECHVIVFGSQNVGGICGYQGSTAGHTSRVTGCTSYASVKGWSYNVGGISGTISSSGNSFIEDCKAYGEIYSSSYNVGGICGYAISIGETTIDGCVAYGNLRGLYSVGGICGYFKCNNAACQMNIVNCLYAGEKIEAFGNNGKNGYTMATGMVGWLQVSAGSANIVNSVSRVRTIETVSTYNGFKSGNNTMAGIVGFQNGSPASCNIYGVYTTIEKSGFVTDGATYAESAATNYYGGIYAKIHADSYKITTLANCYYNPAVERVGPGSNVLTKLDTATVGAYGDMNTLLADLNAAVAAYDGTCGRTLRTWTLDADGYPVIEGLTSELEPGKTKRISVIGDSISTFRGFLPYGYPNHYPTTDGDLTSVSQTYWYRLAYDLMSDAVIDRNIAFSGSAVARTTDTKYSSYTWFGNDYCSRFIAQNGVGNPDIVIIHGGTNDCGHNADPLAPGVDIKSADAPSDEAFAEMFGKADAAVTRAEVEALDDTTFCTAYIKLICLLRERYPNVKIVCLIGDCLTTGVEKSTIRIAEHYGARYVDLYAVNGYNDQTYMPKHDYNPETGKGCHPGSAAMKFIAEKIYTELGDWLEE